MSKSSSPFASSQKTPSDTSSFVPDYQCEFGSNCHCPNNEHTISPFYLQSSETPDYMKESIEEIYGPETEMIKEKKNCNRKLRFYDGEDGDEAESKLAYFEPNIEADGKTNPQKTEISSEKDGCSGNTDLPLESTPKKSTDVVYEDSESSTR